MFNLRYFGICPNYTKIFMMLWFSKGYNTNKIIIFNWTARISEIADFASDFHTNGFHFYYYNMLMLFEQFI